MPKNLIHGTGFVGVLGQVKLEPTAVEPSYLAVVSVVNLQELDDIVTLFAHS